MRPVPAEDDPLPVLPAPPGHGFRRHEVVLLPGDSLPYVEEEWRDALVVIEHGQVELHCRRGGHRAFAAGALLWLDGLDLRAVVNPGPGHAVLAAVARRRRPASG